MNMLLHFKGNSTGNDSSGVGTLVLVIFLLCWIIRLFYKHTKRY